jgi:hypothetical protein
LFTLLDQQPGDEQDIDVSGSAAAAADSADALDQLWAELGFLPAARWLRI